MGGGDLKSSKRERVMNYTCMKAENGVYISNEKYKLSIVEYKPTQPKYKLFRHEDFMQVFAQKICVDYIINCDCDAFFLLHIFLGWPKIADI